MQLGTKSTKIPPEFPASTAPSTSTQLVEEATQVDSAPQLQLVTLLDPKRCRDSSSCQARIHPTTTHSPFPHVLHLLQQCTLYNNLQLHMHVHQDRLITSAMNLAWSIQNGTQSPSVQILNEKALRTRTIVETAAGDKISFILSGEPSPVIPPVPAMTTSHNQMMYVTQGARVQVTA